MADMGLCSLPADYNQQAPLSGIMFVSGYIMHFSDDGTMGIMSVRGGGSKFVMFSRGHFYINTQKFSANKKLFDVLKKGTAINVFMRDMGDLREVSTFRVQYLAELCWIGTYPSVPPFVIQNPDLLNTKSKENTPPMNKIFDIIVDVPIRDLKEHEGVVYWCSDQCGLLSVRTKAQFITNILFSPRVVFWNGAKFPQGENLSVLCADRFFSVYAKRIPRQKIFGVPVTEEAVLVWRGNKPSIRLVHRHNDSYSRPALNPMQNTVANTNIQQEKCNVPIEGRPSESTSKSFTMQPIHSDKQKCNMLSHSDSDIFSAVYMTGTYHGIHDGAFIYGCPDKASRFSSDKFFVDGLQLSSNAEITRYIMSSSTRPILHGYVVPLASPVKHGKYTVISEVMYVWHGPAPAMLKEKIKKLMKNAPQKKNEESTATVAKKMNFEVMVDRADLVGKESIAIARPIKKGRVSGYVLTCSATDAVLTGFTNTVFIIRERFYVNGRKFRNTSLLDYFKKNNEQKVYTYLVPMKPTIVRGCAVFSRAVCAWVGKEPRELSKLIHDDKLATNFEVTDCSRDMKDCFYYFVGRVHKLGEKYGVMQCDVEGEHTHVSFSLNELYKNGKKVNEKSILAIHMKLLMTSRWSVLAYRTDDPIIPGLEYAAVAVWHHENQPLLFDDFQNKILLWKNKLITGTCECQARLDKLLKKPYSDITRGYVTEKTDDELAIGVKDIGLVWLNRNRVWVDGCSCYFSDADEHRICSVVFGEDEQTPLFAWMGKEPAIDRNNRCESFSGRIGSDDDSDSDDDQHKEHDDEKYFEDVYEDTESESSSSENEESNIDMTDVSDPYDLIQISTKNSFAPLRRPKNKKKASARSSGSAFRNFVGRYVLGKIVSITNENVVVSWLSSEYKGTVFVILDAKYLFINCVAFCNIASRNDDSLWTDRMCHLYIYSLSRPEHHGQLEVSARATVGWIGSKPVFVPPPGKQKLKELDYKCLRIGYSDSPSGMLKFCSLDEWKKFLAEDDLMKEKERRRNEEQKKREEMQRKEQEKRVAKLNKLCNSMMSGQSSNRGAEQVSSGLSSLQLGSSGGTKAKKGPSVTSSVSSSQVQNALLPPYTPAAASSVAALNARTEDWWPEEDSVPRPQLTELPVAAAAVTDSSSSSSSSSSGARAVPAAAAASASSASVLEGKVVELHPSLGRLVGADGQSHYFTPDQFVLHGVSLDGVELYCVLVQELPVQYSLDESGRLGSAWHGSRVAFSREQAALNILRWCDDNLVPQDTQDTLIRTVSKL